MADALADVLTDFLWKHCKYLHGGIKETLRDAVKKHIDFKTIVCIWEKAELIGVCRFNVDEREADILDVAVRPDHRKKDILLQLLLQGLTLWPNVCQLRFHSISSGRDMVTPVKLLLSYKNGKLHTLRKSS